MPKYKLVTQNYLTRKGYPNETKWEVGKTVFAENPSGNEFYSPDVVHYYDSPEMALVCNCIHANIPNPRLLEVKGKSVASDGLKGGAKSLKVVRELPLPVVSTEARIHFSILAAKQVYNNPSWNNWADNWLNRKDRTAKAARAAADAADAARAAWAADAAAWAAGAAGGTGKQINFTKLLKQAIKAESLRGRSLANK